MEKEEIKMVRILKAERKKLEKKKNKKKSFCYFYSIIFQSFMPFYLFIHK